MAQHDPKPTRSVGLAKPSTVGVVIQMVTVLLAVLVGVLPSSATAGAPAFTYDIPTTARVDTHDFNAAGTSPAQVRGAREESAPLLVDAQGTSTTPTRSFVATEAATSTRVVIGGMEDLGPGSLRAGEETLASRLPGDTGSRLGNWLNNRAVLRAAMREGVPIRDASVDSAGNLLYEDTRRFITMERDYLRSFNWTYDPSTNLWMPPG